MPQRYLFRMTYYLNLQGYFADRVLFAKNQRQAQSGYRISYEDIVARRGTQLFTTPCGSNVNDFVPFYFSPITKMAFAIHKGIVPLRNAANENLGPANMADIAYLVVNPITLLKSNRDCWFTDIACNSAIPPNYENQSASLSSHVAWDLFDELPRIAEIPEIGYEGVCKYQLDRDEPIKHQQRSKKRMAEFLVRNYLNMNEVSCILLKTEKHAEEVRSWIGEAGLNVPVFVKPGCYF